MYINKSYINSDKTMHRINGKYITMLKDITIKTVYRNN